MLPFAFLAARLSRSAVCPGLVSLMLLSACSPETGTEPGHGRDPLVDVTSEVELDFVHFNGMSGELYVSEVIAPGAALFDYDGDGDLDVYVTQGLMIGPGKTYADALLPFRGEMPPRDRLFRNDLAKSADGVLAVRFRDVTDDAGLLATGYGMGVATGDYDNDGDQDLYVTNHGSNQLWRSEGDGRFTDVTSTTGTDDPRWSTSAVFVDYDRDGWLDLFVVNYVDYRPGVARTCREPDGRLEYCGPQTHEPELDRLLRNRGDGTFEDATLDSGIFRTAASGLGVVAADLNSDGWVDLYIANDLMRNHLWLNQGDGTFHEGGLESGAALNMEGVAEASMGVDVGDLDGDGDLDLFMTHLREQTNTYYRNDGSGLFLDASVTSRLAEPSVGYTGFGTAVLDLESDGDLDILSVNGDIKSLSHLREIGDPFPLHQPNQLFVNDGAGEFSEIQPPVAALEISEVSRGVAIGDLDNDGDPDVVISNNGGPTRVLDNTTDGTARWLGASVVRPDGSQAHAGTNLWLEVGGHRLYRRARTDGSFLSARDSRVLFGAGTSDLAATLEIRRPSGARRRWHSPPIDHYLVLGDEAPAPD